MTKDQHLRKLFSNSRVTSTILEDERVPEDEENIWGRPESQSSSLLPKTRRIYKQTQIRDSVLQSRHEGSRLADILSNQQSAITPSIRKALKDRANFYRRKLTFYENLDVMASSMTSNEIINKLHEGNNDLNSSRATSFINQ